MYGSVSAVNIIHAHEIYHKEGSFRKIIASIAMINTFYGHWLI